MSTHPNLYAHPIDEEEGNNSLCTSDFNIAFGSAWSSGSSSGCILDDATAIDFMTCS